MTSLYHSVSLLCLCLISLLSPTECSLCPTQCECLPGHAVVCNVSDTSLSNLTSQVPRETSKLTFYIQYTGGDYIVSSNTMAPLPNLTQLTILPEPGRHLVRTGRVRFSPDAFENHPQLKCLELNVPVDATALVLQNHFGHFGCQVELSY